MSASVEHEPCERVALARHGDGGERRRAAGRDGAPLPRDPRRRRRARPRGRGRAAPAERRRRRHRARARAAGHHRRHRRRRDVVPRRRAGRQRRRRADGTPELAVCPTSAGGLEAALAQSDSAASRRAGSFIRWAVQRRPRRRRRRRRPPLRRRGAWRRRCGAATASSSCQLAGSALPSLDDIATSASATLASADGTPLPPAIAGRAEGVVEGRSPSPPASSARSPPRGPGRRWRRRSPRAPCGALPRRGRQHHRDCAGGGRRHVSRSCPTARRRGTAMTCGTAGCADPASTAPASRCPRR